MPENTVTAKYCAFQWCTEDHHDEWVNDEAGDPVRSHTIDIGLPDVYPYLVVEEVRRPSGIVLSPVKVCISDAEDHLSIDEFADMLHQVIAQLPTWRDIAADIEDRRLAAQSCEDES